MNPELCELLMNGGIVSCFLVDSEGVPLDPFDPLTMICREIPSPDGRENVPVTLPDGEEVVLQKVIIQKSGFIAVEVTNGTDTCVSDPIPFCKIEEVLLCAPAGTEVICRITDFRCFACVNCQNGFYQSLEVFLEICQDLQTVTDAVVELTANNCLPREVIIPERCPAPMLPPSCPLLRGPNFQEDAGEEEKGLEETKQVPTAIVEQSALPTISQMENLCIQTQNVYDWIVHQSSITIRRSADDAPFACGQCSIGLFVPAIIVCERGITGNVECDGERVPGVPVFFTASSDIVTFDPNPVFTDENGNFRTVVTVPDDTDPTEITITASTEIDGQEISTTLPTIVRCTGECLLTLSGPDTIDCNDVVAGRVRCGNETLEGVEVTLTADPPILNFNPNPATTGSAGTYFSGVSVPNGTPPTNVEITASATVEGNLLTESINVNVSCESDCTLTLTSDPLITCTGEITGTIECDGLPIEGALIIFSDFPEIGTFTPNPAISLADGSFTTTLTIPEGTPLLSTSITASTTVDGSTVETTIGVQVECPEVECPCKFRIGVEGGSAPATVDITDEGVPSTLTGTINVTAVQCFTASPMCNPANNNFNIAFGSNGTTINFLQGRRIEIECEDNTFARVRGTARAAGNVFDGNIFEVTIELTITGPNTGSWSIFATDFHGNTFSTMFSSELSPVTFIGDCDETP